MNTKGVTLISLSIYVVVAGVVIAALAFLNVNIISQISELTDKTEISNEYAKFCSAFISDLKASSNITTYTKNEITFSNGIKYLIKKVSDKDEYAIYKDSVKVCEGIVLHNEIQGESVLTGPYFDYDYTSNILTVVLKFKKGSFEFVSDESYLVGKGF